MNRRKLTKVLLESGCDLGARNKQGESASDIARRKHLGDIVDILARHTGQATRRKADAGKSVDDSDDVDAIRLAPDCEDDEEEEDEGIQRYRSQHRRDHSSNSSKENWEAQARNQHHVQGGRRKQQV